MRWLLALLGQAKSSSDVVLAGVMAAILGAMIVPLPAWLLDAGIALNLAAAVSLLVAALYARDALKVAAFPTLLLITTLFRLALNVSSTRLALSEGHAGEIIQAFGEFVVRGDYVVGAVIFAILTLVQFLVVTKGAERVAEVSARFTLDAMPGKQMSIDADLRAGAINMQQARARRRDLERESQMFGAMDGAMKFIKGDVIAGLVITAVNLLGGVAIGVLQNGLTVGEAASVYALISIGDGLVSQIPSLCIAVAAGLVVTRVSSETDDASLGSEIGAQFFGQWKALWVVGGLCVAMGLLPGMPHLTFLSLAAMFVAGGMGLRRLAERDEPAPGRSPGSEAQSPAAPASVQVEAAVGAAWSPLVLDLSAALTPLTVDDGGLWVREDLQRVRDQVRLELGVPLPGFRVRTGAPALQPGQYCLLVDEVPCARGQLELSGVYALALPADLALLHVPGQLVAPPGIARPVCWVAAEHRPRLEAAKVALVPAAHLLCGHLVAALRRRAVALLGVQQVQSLLEELELAAPALVKEALAKIPLALLTDVLRRLVQEQVSIRNLRAVLEALVSPSAEGDAQALAEHCRRALHGYLSHKYAAQGPLLAFLVDPSLEEALRQAGPHAALEPRQASAVIASARKLATSGGGVVLASPDIRRGLKSLLEVALPELAVLSYLELDPELQIRPMGRLALEG